MFPAELAELINSIESQTFRMEQRLDEMIELSRMAHTLSDKAKGITTSTPKRTEQRTVKRTEPAPKSQKPSAPAPPVETADGDIKLGLAERKIVAILLAHSGERTKRQLAVQCGYAINGGGFNNALSRLRTLELITAGGDPIRLVAVPDGFVPPPGFSTDAMPSGGRALLNFWLTLTGASKLGKAEKLIMEALWGHPEGMAKEDLAAVTGYEAGGGGFNNALSRLRTLELMSGGSGQPLKLDATFFE